MFRRRLEDFYRAHNPACLDSIDDILEIFSGREEELFHVLEEKYADLDTAPQMHKMTRPLRASQNDDRRVVCRSVAQSLLYPDEESHLSQHDTDGRRKVNDAELDEHQQVGPSKMANSAFMRYPEKSSCDLRTAGTSEFSKVERELATLREENEKLKAAHHSLKCDAVILHAEKEALLRQSRNDEETIEKLRAHIARHDVIERELIEDVSSSQLKGKSVLNEEQFAAIISASQERLKSYYEEKLAFMQMEMDTFYTHAAERIKEKDSIIAAFKELLPHS